MKTSLTDRQLRLRGILFICISAFISFVLANTIDLSHHELGAFTNFFWPPLLGMLSLVVFLIVTFISKDRFIWKFFLVVLCFYNLYVGFALHIERDDWPFVGG
jgi:hypothetical protein